MRLAILHLQVLTRCGNQPEVSSYTEGSLRFRHTYQQYRTAVPHDLILVQIGDGGTRCGLLRSDLFDGLSHLRMKYEGMGSDCGAYQHCVRQLDYDLVLCCNTFVHFWRHGWCEPIVSAFERNGPGIYGITASYEGNPHLRTPCIGISPSVLRKYPHECLTRDDAGSFEFGDDNLGLWAHRNGFPSRLVTEERDYPMRQWRKPTDIFRRGDQSNCLVWDRHTELYFNADRAAKKLMQRKADRRHV